jgi:hypothetical protein
LIEHCRWDLLVWWNETIQQKYRDAMYIYLDAMYVYLDRLTPSQTASIDLLNDVKLRLFLQKSSQKIPYKPLAMQQAFNLFFETRKHIQLLLRSCSEIPDDIVNHILIKYI